MKSQEEIKDPTGSGLITPFRSPEFVVEFGKHKGKSLNQIAEDDNAYILWLDRENVLSIEPDFLAACQMDDYLDDGECWDVFRND